MENSNLDKLIMRARSHTMTAQERHEQGISYILGNAAVEQSNLFRGTVTMAVPQRALEPTYLAGSVQVGEVESRVPFDVNGAVRQFRLVQKLVEQNIDSRQPVKIDAQLICQMHAAAGDPADQAFGNFRSTEVIVGAHRAPSASDIVALVDAFCTDLASRWHMQDALHLSAFALWRLAWIHPFLDANGRTARAISYLILNLKFGFLLPGAPTILEQLSDRRSQYFNALSMADATHDSTGVADIEPLAQLLEELLVRQLRNLPSQSYGDDAALAEIFERRILQADSDLLVRIYGDSSPRYRSWASADTLLVHVGSASAIAHAEALFERYGRPFPHLLSGPGQKAKLTLDAQQRGAIVRLRNFVVDEAALHLEPNAAVVIDAPHIVFTSDSGAGGWEVAGALYALRSGDQINALWRFDVLDSLISRHLQEG